MALTALLNKIQALDAFSFEQELVSIVDDNKDRLVELQREQLQAGKDINGNPITLDGRGYSPLTVKIRRAKGLQTSVVDWKFTGEMYRTLFASVSNRRFSIDSQSFKFAKLQQRSPDARGLNLESRRKFGQEVVLPEIRRRLKARTGLTIK